VSVQQTAGTLTVAIDGQPLPDPVAHLLTSAIIDGNQNQPDLFSIRFRDPNHEVLQKTGAKIGSKVVIKAFSTKSPGGDQLLTGDVTSLEVEHNGSGTFTVLTGYDESHRLNRGRISQTYQNVTYSDIATTVAKRAGLTPGQIDATTPVYDWVAQDNTNDWSFLQRLAKEVGYEVVVVDGQLHFRSPTPSADAPAGGDLSGQDSATQLTMGSNLLRLRGVITSGDQVSEVHVRGWDPKAKQSIVGTAQAGTSNASSGSGTTPGSLAQVFGSPILTSVDVPYSSQAEADKAAQSLADHVGNGFAEIHGVARGNAKLKAGSAISLSLAGDPFDGRYVLTSTRHQLDSDDGYTTAFSVTGKNQRSLLGLASGGTGGTGSGGSSQKIPGVVIAIVTDVNDPENLARVKVTYPWLSDGYGSDWVRVAQFGAGPERGAVFLPEVGDEVLVAFDHGDPRLAFVIGSLYNGMDTPPLGDGLIDGTSGHVNRRGIVSKDSHMLVFFDGPSQDGVALMTGDHGLRVSLNQTNTEIKISSEGKITISGDADVTVSSQADLTVQAQGTLSLQGTSVSIQGDSQVSVSGGVIKLN